MKNKKWIYVLVATILLVLVVVLLFIFLKEDKVRFDTFEKYRLDVTIDAKKNGTIKSYLIGIASDGKNVKISSSNVNKDSYIVGNKLYFLEGDTFYWYEVDKSYSDLYKTISEFDRIDVTKEDGSIKNCSSALNARSINEILEELFFQKKVSSSSLAKVVVKDEKVSNFEMTLNDIEGYDEVTISIVAKELDEQYRVDTSRIFGGGGGGRIYKMSQAEENVYEIRD